METTEIIRSFLARHVKKADLGEEEDIFRAGYVDSMFAMELVQFVEAEFNLSVQNEDLEFDNFRSIKAIAALVAKKRGG